MSTSQQSRSLAHNLVRQFGPGVTLIAAAAAVLLFSDPRWRRERRAADAPKKVALVNYVSVPVLEDGEAGVIAGLKEAGFIDGKNIELRRYNAEGDRSTAIMIAKEVVGGDFDLVLTLSTPVLQAVANANLDTQRFHVFTLSTDPWGAGVGISAENHADHPAYMTGQGTVQPVEGLFHLAREANPHLTKVGVVWNPAESNSEASTKLAREVCKKMHIELLESTIDSSSGVLDAAKALIARDVQAFWAGGDATVAPAIDALIGAARDAGIPVFTNMPSNVKQGALLALGADYFEVGHSGGLLAARVLNGTDPATIPVDNYVPEVLALNLVALPKFQAKWKFRDDWPKRANLIVDAQGAHKQLTPAKP
jgi:putative tryptophan/tyrosine transport system substrate-binding protein